MEWSIKAENKLNELIKELPESFRDSLKEGTRREAERYAEEKSINFIEVKEVVAGYILATPAHQREELKERLINCGIDWHKYSELFRQ